MRYAIQCRKKAEPDVIAGYVGTYSINDRVYAKAVIRSQDTANDALYICRSPKDAQKICRILGKQYRKHNMQFYPVKADTKEFPYLLTNKKSEEKLYCGTTCIEIYPIDATKPNISVRMNYADYELWHIRPKKPITQGPQNACDEKEKLEHKIR